MVWPQPPYQIQPPHPPNSLTNSATTTFHASVNHQVTHNAYQPFIPHPIITSLLSTSLDSEDSDNDGVDTDNNDNNNDIDNLQANDHTEPSQPPKNLSIMKIVKLQEATHQLAGDFKATQNATQFLQRNFQVGNQSMLKNQNKVLKGRSRGRDSVNKEIHNKINLPPDTFQAHGTNHIVYTPIL